MNLEYRRSINGSFVCVWNEEMSTSDFQLEMMKNNKIPGLLSCKVVTEDGIDKACFCISGNQPVSAIYSKKQLDRKIVYEIIKSVWVAIEGAKEYMLSPDGIIFDFEYMYMNMDSHEINYLFDINSKDSALDSINKLAEMMIAKVDHKDREATKLAYEFFEITNKGDYLISDIKKLVEHNQEVDSKAIQSDFQPGVDNKLPKRERKIEEKILVNDKSESIPRVSDDETESPEKKHWIDYLIWILAVGIILWLIYDNLIRKFGRKANIIMGIVLGLGAIGLGFIMLRKIKLKKDSDKKGCRSKNNFTKKVKSKTNRKNKNNQNQEESNPKLNSEQILEDNSNITVTQPEIDLERTGLLIIEDNNNPKLISSGETDIVIELNHYPFILGKSKEHVTFTINDSYVSRIHCEFNMIDGIISVKDLNSTNGTKVNGELICPMTKVFLETGDRIKIGKVELVLDI